MLSHLKLTRRAFPASAVALALALASCGSETPNTNNTNKSASTPAPATSAPVAAASGPNVSLSGAGATFPAPLYQRWFSEYNKANPNIKISYQSVGSGAGVKQFTAATIDFGASDTGMKDDEISKVSKGVLLVPATAGSIVLAYNLPDAKDIKLSRKVYTDIFLGKITKWNDPEIAKLNPGAKLPDTPITVVSRSDGSGTTANFTKHLSAISEEWKSGPGTDKSVKFPVGVSAKGNEGVTAQIQQTPGAIGYTEYGYAKQNNLAVATLENKAGKYITPSAESGAKALEAIKLPDNFLASSPDPEGAESYPIVTYTWLLVNKKYEDPNKSKAIKDVLKWSLNDGQKFSAELGYIPLPKEVVSKVQPAIDSITP